MATRKNSRMLVRSGKARGKLDPRLAYLLSLGPQRLFALRQREIVELGRIEKEVIADRGPTIDDRRRPGDKNRRPRDRLFSPLSTGVYFPARRGEPPTPIRLREPWFSCFILSDASASDLVRLGVRVRCQQ